jgi:hypothetical protein
MWLGTRGPIEFHAISPTSKPKYLRAPLRLFGKYGYELAKEMVYEVFENLSEVLANEPIFGAPFDGPLSWQWCSLWKTWCKDLTNRLSLNAGSKALELLGPGIDVSSVARFLRSEGQ